MDKYIEMVTQTEKELEQIEDKINSKTKKVFKTNIKLAYKLGIKTRALWIAAGIIQENLEQSKTQEQIYEFLKLLGERKYKTDKSE